MARTRTPELGPSARPVTVPEDLDDPSLTKASGRIELPLHIRWSGPPVAYDLANRADRARVYEQVLREGSDEDVRYYVEADKLRELFDELVLPSKGPAGLGGLAEAPPVGAEPAAAAGRGDRRRLGGSGGSFDGSSRGSSGR